MSNLTKFILSHNQLTVMPDCVHSITCQSSFPHLRYLDLSSNQIASVPKVDTHLRDLEYLNLSRNRLEDIPDEFLICMPSLRVLNASMNEICKFVVQCVIYIFNYANIECCSQHWWRGRTGYGTTSRSDFG